MRNDLAQRVRGYFRAYFKTYLWGLVFISFVVLGVLGVLDLSTTYNQFKTIPEDVTLAYRTIESGSWR